ncbi:hypothetical protein PRUPE_5G233400 [Prunus persica]|uniref:Uncharacterized protein n=1 Tax=Prunus persica TaxID=3760 RepID=A0A251PCM5_PRUPE|nr:hypothetical protein PRUPE_5G233400 [Prunus persica]
MYKAWSSKACKIRLNTSNKTEAFQFRTCQTQLGLEKGKRQTDKQNCSILYGKEESFGWKKKGKRNPD